MMRGLLIEISFRFTYWKRSREVEREEHEEQEDREQERRRRGGPAPPFLPGLLAVTGRAAECGREIRRHREEIMAMRTPKGITFVRAGKSYVIKNGATNTFWRDHDRAWTHHDMSATRYPGRWEAFNALFPSDLADSPLVML